MNLTEPQQGKPFAIVESKGALLQDIPESDFIAWYKKYGAIMFRGFDVDMDTFQALTNRYCVSSVFNESPDRRLLDETTQVQTVNLGTAPFPLHPELSREPFKPDVCFFWCIEPPEGGGQTTVCDGVEIVKSMPPQLYNIFARRRFLYRQLASSEVCEYWLGEAMPSDAQLANTASSSCPYHFFRNPAGKIVREFSRPALHKPMFCDDLAFGNFLLFARYHLNMKKFPSFDGPELIPDSVVTGVKNISDRLTAPAGWQPGDVLVLDNTRFMHGRTAIANPDQRLIASYFGYLAFAEPDAEEPKNAVWRREAFTPPHKKMVQGR